MCVADKGVCVSVKCVCVCVGGNSYGCQECIGLKSPSGSLLKLGSLYVSFYFTRTPESDSHPAKSDMAPWRQWKECKRENESKCVSVMRVCVCDALA